METNLRKLLLPRVNNGLPATIFCVTRKIVHAATTETVTIFSEFSLKT